MQAHINSQQQVIKSLKTKIATMANVEKNTIMDNKIVEVERENQKLKHQIKTIEGRNQDQRNELQILTKDTEYEEQIEGLQREINKWKDKNKLLTNYQKEEDENFKKKFDLLINVGENRSKIKETIIQVKYGKGTQGL